MATQAQKDKAITAAEKRLSTVTKREEKLSKRIEGYDELVIAHGLALKAVEVAKGEVEWAKSRPVLDGDDADTETEEV